jgi:hypothetical protein
MLSTSRISIPPRRLKPDTHIIHAKSYNFLTSSLNPSLVFMTRENRRKKGHEKG